MKIFVFLILIIGLNLQAQTEITVNLEQKYQTIDNFSASDCWWAHKIGESWDTANKDSLADLLFSTTKGIGLSAWRFNLGAGIDANITDSWRTAKCFETSEGNYNWENNKGGQWFLKAASERGVDQFIAFVNSPPRRMTVNGHSYCSGDGSSTNLKDGYYGQYATYLVDIVKHFRDSLGININYLSPVNEPQWDWNGPSQEGNRAGNSDIKMMVDSLYTELANQKVDANIIIPESGELPGWYSSTSKNSETYGNYLNTLFSNSDVKSKTAKIFAGHSYWSDLLSSEVVQARQSLYKKMSSYFDSGYKYWVTEYCILEGTSGQGGNGRDLTTTTALDVARIIHYDLSEANASAWQWWLAVSMYDYKDGLIYTNINSPFQPILQSKTLWALGNFSRYIRPGSQRIDCSGANDKYGLMASAYVDSANSKIIMVLINVGSGLKEVSFNFSGLDSSQTVNYMTPYVTSNQSGDDLKLYKTFSANSVYSVPAKSVVTIVGLLNGASITDINKAEVNPRGFNLFQNYPNPFNPTTRITYDLPQGDHVTLKVFNMLGQQMAVLVDQDQNTGKHSANFDALNLAGGIYFYRIQAGNFSQTKKMLLLH